MKTFTHSIDVADAQCQTDICVADKQEINHQPVDDDVVILNVHDLSQNQVEVSNRATEKGNSIDRESELNAQITKVHSRQADSVTEKTTLNGKQLYSECFVRLDRLRLEKIRTFRNDLGYTYKIPRKTYMERKLENDEKERMKTINEKSSKVPKLMQEKEKPLVTQSDKSSENKKRKQPDEHDQNRLKHNKILQGKDVIKSIVRNMESLINIDDTDESLSNRSDVESWCLEKIQDYVEKQKLKSIEKSNNDRQKK